MSKVSILNRKNILPNKININTHFQAIAVSANLNKTVSICSLYIPPHDPINEKELNNLIKKNSLNHLILMGDFKSHNMIWGSKTKQQKRPDPWIKSSIATIYISTIKSQTHLTSSSGTFSAIDLTLHDLSIFIDYKWRVYRDPCGSDHYPIIMENSTIKKNWNR